MEAQMTPVQLKRWFDSAEFEKEYHYEGPLGAWLEGANISGYNFANSFKHDSLRKRKLLLHKKQLLKLAQKLEVKGYTLVPLRLYFNDEGLVKLSFALGKGKKEYDKRRALREEEDKKEGGKEKKEI